MKKNELEEELAKTKAHLENTDKALKEAAEAYEAETLSTAEMARRIAELERDKAHLIDKGEKLVRWVESNRHHHEEIRDHNGRLKDTGIWAQFYVAVRGIQRKDTPNSSSQNAGAVSSIPLPGKPGHTEAMRARNRREGIEAELYRGIPQIPGVITAGWLAAQAIEAELNAKALVDRGKACAADAWFDLADAYRSEAEVISSQNN